MAGGDAARATRVNHRKPEKTKQLPEARSRKASTKHGVEFFNSKNAALHAHAMGCTATPKPRQSQVGPVTHRQESAMKPIGARYLETVGPEAPLFNRWKLAAGGRPSKISEGERVRTSNNL